MRTWRVSGLAVALLLLLLAGCASAGSGGAGASASGSGTGTGAKLPRLPVRESWDIQLDSPPRAPFPAVNLIETDGFDTPAATVTALHRSRAGRVVVCYLDAGTWERWRPDAARYLKSLLGRPDDGWAGGR